MEEDRAAAAHPHPRKSSLVCASTVGKHPQLRKRSVTFTAEETIIELRQAQAQAGAVDDDAPKIELVSPPEAVVEDAEIEKMEGLKFGDEDTCPATALARPPTPPGASHLQRQLDPEEVRAKHPQ